MDLGTQHRTEISGTTKDHNRNIKISDFQTGSTKMALNSVIALLT
jgi:hypothetical protein